ncbi:hypothetical protein MIR68_009463 [Amoeboaphelidium protococcarum]|nr:hypothetical protein MIR68_009463 [Amoeboaphelidium protococcarum]
MGQSVIKFRKNFIIYCLVLLSAYLIWKLLVEVFWTRNADRYQTSNIVPSPETLNEIKCRYGPLDVINQVKLNRVDQNYHVIHVSKEGPESCFGGIGRVVTDLSQSTAAEGISVSVVSPFYAYLRRPYDSGESKYLLYYTLQVPVSESALCQGLFCFWSRNRRGGLNFVLNVPVYTNTVGNVKQYLIGPPLEQKSQLYYAFGAESSQDIYYSHPKIPGEVQDLYFNVATAHLLKLLSQSHGNNLIAHVHGATNAPTILFAKSLLNATIKTLYTVHDYGFEPRHSLRMQNVDYFYQNDGIDDAMLSRYILSGKLYPSALGINLADLVSVASQYMFSQLLTQERAQDEDSRSTSLLKSTEFALMKHELLSKCSKGRVVGISNGIGHLISPYKPNNLDGHEFDDNDGDLLTRLSAYVQNTSQPYEFTSAKQRAKIALLSLHSLAVYDNLPSIVVLFIGRFSYEKGMEDVRTMADYIKRNQASLQCRVFMVLMGSHNDYPDRKLKDIGKDHVIWLDSRELQQNYGGLARMAADVVIVPSRNEILGLVALEGLLFGSAVLSTAVGGLKEFLVDRNLKLSMSEDLTFNAYVYDYHSDASLESTFNLMIDDYLHVNEDVMEYNRRRWHTQASKMRWNATTTSPLYTYLKTYQYILHSE